MMGVIQDPEASLFGTDGIRDRAGEGLLALHNVEQIATAVAAVMGSGVPDVPDLPPEGARTVLIARDTRSSGREIFQQLSDTFVRYGFTVKDLGELPTPAIAYLAGSDPAVALGVVISASHNPAEYNGIKFFSHRGEKASDALEAAISKAFWIRSEPSEESFGAVVSAALEGFQQYVHYLLGCVRQPERLRGRRVVVDAANGATYRVAPAVFRALGMNVVSHAVTPDGANINRNCGALHPGRLAELVVESGADLGFSFDGDGDRMIPVGAAGTIFDGDHVLLLSALRLDREGRLPQKTVVATSMTNFGLERVLKSHGLKLLRTDVGDRHVYAEMQRGGHPIGGEQSGHTIYREDATTGDGILSALWLLDSLTTEALDLEAEAGGLERLPQVLLNIRVREKVPFEKLPGVIEAVDAAEGQLAGRGRVVLRYSGTEPLARVMVEGDDDAETRTLADGIGELIRVAIG